MKIFSRNTVNSYIPQALSILIVYGLFISETDSLKCHKCLALETCPEGEDAFCEKIRNYIVGTLRPYYDFGPAGYVPPCHKPEDISQWKADEFVTPACARIMLRGAGPDESTCSLGRIQVKASKPGSSEPLTIHATVMGCMTLKLLNFMKPYSDKQVCSILKDNNTLENFTFKMELENCPKITDFCNTLNFCIPPKESIVKAYRSQSKDSSFEIGIIIAIVAVIFVIFVVLILASIWKNPLKRSVNYSPTQAQATLTSIESPSTSEFH